MLERLLEKLRDGPFETSIAVHGPNLQQLKKARIISADSVGIIASVKGPMGGWGAEVGYPWTAVTVISFGS